MRVLISGGTGFIGRHLVAQMTQKETTAVTLLLRPTSQNSPTPPHCQVVYADLRDRAQTAVAVAAARPEVVIHLAAAGATDPFLAVDTAVAHNLHGSLNLLHACFNQPNPPRQFITARTPGERAAMNVYAASKTAVWQFCRMYARTQGWPIHGAMIFQAYGPGQPTHAFIPAACRAALAGQDFPMTAGTQTRDWIHVADVAGGLAAMLHSPLEPGTTVELGGGQATSLLAVAALIYELVGRGGRPLPDALPSRPGEVDHQVADAALTAARIGWRATTSLRAGLAALCL